MLILGGTRFAGRHIAEACLAAGHRVTLLHRGLTGREVLPSVPRIFADRDAPFEVPAGFDAVIDTSGTTGERVRRSAATLGDVPRYLFLSSIAVYRDAWSAGEPALDEDAPLGGPGGYAEEKLAAERALDPHRACIIRAGFLVGPHDPEDRLDWWAERARSGRPFVAPGDAGRELQILDARDLAAWIVRLVGEGARGVFNAVGAPRTWGALLEALAGGSPCAPRWVPDELLIERGITGLPLWIPGGGRRIDGARAAARGLAERASELGP